jgi:hypothetical protein
MNRTEKRNRTALVSDALREHLPKLKVREMEDRDRQGYSKRPQLREEAHAWEAEAAWPTRYP